MKLNSSLPIQCSPLVPQPHEIEATIRNFEY
jgi:hypothetical protein